MSFVVVGTNHKYSPIEIRERISFSKSRLKPALSWLLESEGLGGAVMLSTCNRIEVYASTSCTEIGVDRLKLKEFLSRYHEIDTIKIDSYLYSYQGLDAIWHLFEVASGLDSQVLGETQILGQVKFAYSQARDVYALDELLDRVFTRAVNIAKRIHIETKISQGNLSIGSVAVNFIKERIGSLSGKNILVIGVGKVSELVVKYIIREQPNVVFVSNRTFEKARELAYKIDGKAIGFDKFEQALRDADIVISATASPHLIIKKEHLINIGRSLLIIDLAVPRDVDPKVKDIKGIELYNLDDLGSVIQENLERRESEARIAREIIDIEVAKLWEELLRLEPEPASLP